MTGRSDPPDLSFSDDAMNWESNPVSVSCAKCGQHGERNAHYCGPGQRRSYDNWGYPFSPRRASLTERLLRRLVTGRPATGPKDVAECEIPGEHFHLWCQYCQYKWTEALPAD